MKLYSCSGCDKPNAREKRTTFIRFRSFKDIGNDVSPRAWSLSPTGIVTTPGESLSVATFRILNPGCMSLSGVSKLTPGTGSLRSRTCRAGLRQGVGARDKDMPALGYSVAVLRKAAVRPSFVSGGIAGGYAHTLYF